jgi:hypothetical protein
MKVVQLLLPKTLSLTRFRMATRLPETTVSIPDCFRAQRFQKALWTMSDAIIAELPTCVFAKIGQGPHQSLRIQLGIKDNHVYVCGHDDKGVDPQVFLAVTEGQAIGDDFTIVLRDEHRQPFGDQVRQVINCCFRVDAIAFHRQNCNKEICRIIGPAVIQPLASVAARSPTCFGALLWHSLPTVSRWTLR